MCLWVTRATLWPPSSAAHSYTKLPISFFCSPKLLHLSSALFQVLKSWVKLAQRASPWPPRGHCTVYTLPLWLKVVVRFDLATRDIFQATSVASSLSTVLVAV